MKSKLLDQIKNNPEFMDTYSTGMSSLFRSGVLQFLREVGRPRIISLGDNSNVMATQAARSAGYNEALDDLLNFREYFIDPSKDTYPDVTPEYGGLDKALLRGDLEEEELHAIRSGVEPDYKSIASRFRTNTKTS